MTSINTDSIAQDVEAAHLAQSEAAINVFHALAKLSIAKQQLAEAEAERLAEPLEGKTAPERSAHLRRELQGYHSAVHLAQMFYDTVKLEEKLADIENSRAHALVQLAVVKGGS